MLLSSLDGDQKTELITGSSKTHGVQPGEKMDTSELRWETAELIVMLLSETQFFKLNSV